MADQQLSVPARAGIFVRNVLPESRQEALKKSLPSHVKPERFERNLIIAVTQQPKLLNCDPQEVWAEVSKAAALGLYLDPQLGEAYLIVSWNGRERREVPQLRLGYRGLIKLGRQSGEIAQLYAHEARAKDMLRVSLGSSKMLVHEPDYLLSEDERGEIVMFYAVVLYKDGTTDFEPMALKAVEAIRDRSDGWRAYADGKIKSTPWSTDFDEMAKKTVLRRLMKRLPQSPEIADALALEDRDFREEVVVERPSLRARLEAPGAASGGFSRDHVHRALETPTEAAETVLEPDLDEVLQGDEVPSDWGEPPQDEPAGEPEWNHLAWIVGIKDQASTFRQKESFRQWYGIITKGEDFQRLRQIDSKVADLLIQDLIDLGKGL